MTSAEAIPWAEIPWAEIRESAPRVLLPRHKIYVHVDVDVDDCSLWSSDVFVQRFRETWGALPLGVRRGLLKFWAGWGTAKLAATPGYKLRPKFRLCSRMLETNPFGQEFEREMNAIGSVRSDGMEISFAGVFFDNSHDEASLAQRSLIAHELGHVWMKAIGRSSDDDDREHAEMLPITEAWGFSEEAIDRELQAIHAFHAIFARSAS